MSSLPFREGKGAMAEGAFRKTVTPFTDKAAHAPQGEKQEPADDGNHPDEEQQPGGQEE